MEIQVVSCMCRVSYQVCMSAASCSIHRQPSHLLPAGIAVQSEGLCEPLARIEMPLVRVLAEMEHTRIAVNVQALALQK